MADVFGRIIDGIAGFAIRATYRRRYRAESVVVRGIAPSSDGRTWLFYQTPLDTLFYSPGVEIDRSGDDLHVAVLRQTVEDGKGWRPKANQIEGLRLWEWTAANGTLPLGIGQCENVVAVPLPSKAGRVFLTGGSEVGSTNGENSDG